MVVLPDQKQDKHDARAAKQTDHDGAGPSVLVAAVVQGQKELDCGGCEDYKPEEVEFGADDLQDGNGAWLDCFGHFDKDEQERGDGADGEVNIEACLLFGQLENNLIGREKRTPSPSHIRSKRTTKKRSAHNAHLRQTHQHTKVLGPFV